MVSLRASAISQLPPDRNAHNHLSIPADLTPQTRIIFQSIHHLIQTRQAIPLQPGGLSLLLVQAQPAEPGLSHCRDGQGKARDEPDW